MRHEAKAKELARKAVAESQPYKMDCASFIVEALLLRALAACALEVARPFKEALMVNPFSDGQDGDLCLWCRTSYPRGGLMTFEEHFLQEHHLATCELMLVMEKWAALERAAEEGKS